MNKKLLTCALLTLSLSLVAQQGDGGLPKSGKATHSIKLIDKKLFSEPDITALRAEDEVTDPGIAHHLKQHFPAETIIKFFDGRVPTDLAGEEIEDRADPTDRETQRQNEDGAGD